MFYNIFACKVQRNVRNVTAVQIGLKNYVHTTLCYVPVVFVYLIVCTSRLNSHVSSHSTRLFFSSKMCTIEKKAKLFRRGSFSRVDGGFKWMRFVEY